MMTPDVRGRLRDRFVRHEALRLKPYLDCCGKSWRVCTCTTKGKLTIGIGRNLEDRGLTPNEAFYLNANDIDQAGRDDAGNDWRKRRFVHVRGLKLATSGSVLSGLETLA